MLVRLYQTLILINGQMENLLLSLGMEAVEVLLLLLLIMLLLILMEELIPELVQLKFQVVAVLILQQLVIRLLVMDMF